MLSFDYDLEYLHHYQGSQGVGMLTYFNCVARYVHSENFDLSPAIHMTISRRFEDDAEDHTMQCPAAGQVHRWIQCRLDVVYEVSSTEQFRFDFSCQKIGMIPIGDMRCFLSVGV